MRILVLGGTHFVGRALVETLLAAGDQVTTLTSGTSGPPAEGADARYADRRDPAALTDALGSGEWDAVVDTSSLEPLAVRTAVSVLRGRVGHWTYVSSRSVYASPLRTGLDESAPLWPGDPASTDADFYPGAKCGGELAALEADCPVVLARVGLVLGPYENVGRLPFWLERISRGDRVPVPGPPERSIQYVDARDAAAWIRAGASAGRAGAFNVTTRTGEHTFGELMEACRSVTDSDAELVWVPPEAVAEAGVAPWTELPIWLPPEHEHAALHDSSTAAAEAAGFVSRPLISTVRDTWTWVQAEGMPSGTARGREGMDAAAERRLWAAYSRALADGG